MFLRALSVEPNLIFSSSMQLVEIMFPGNTDPNPGLEKSFRRLLYAI